MASSRARSPFAFPITLLLTLVVALLPVRSRLGWSRDVAEIVRFPLRPFTHAGGLVAAWLRPGPSPADGLPAEAKELVEQLVEDRDVAQRLYQRERQRNRELEEQIRLFQLLPDDVIRSASRVVIGHVTARNPDNGTSIVELRIDREAIGDVHADTVAVYGGVHLLGITAGEPKRNACALLPIVSKANDPIRARVTPKEDPARPADECPLILLEPTGTGTFTGDVKGSVVVAEGDVVRLDDPKWPPTAQMMTVGLVESIAPSPEEPLRNRIRVRPVYQVQEVAYATLIIQEREDEEPAP